MNVTKTEGLHFLKPGRYMSASDNRFVQLPRIEPCLVLENFQPKGDHNRYVVLAKDEQLVAWSNDILNENEAVG